MKKVVFTFGRMNPPTIGHEKLVNKLKAIASKEKADARLYLSHTNKPGSDPLSYKNKLKFAQIAFGIAYKSNAKQIFQIAKELQGQDYTDIVMVVGSDRVKEFDTLLKKYNGKGDYDFDSIKVVSAGQRDPDAVGVEGMSGTKLRNLAKDGDIKTFMSGLASGLSASDKKKIYALVSKNMKEAYYDIEMDNILMEDSLNEKPMTVQQRVARGRIMKKLAPKMAKARARNAKRMADPRQLKQRAQKAAINAVRKKVAGKKGLNYANLSPSDKMNVDKLVQKKSALIAKIAKKSLPIIRKKEQERLAAMRSSKTEDHDLSEEAEISLRNKAAQAGIMYDIIKEVYDRGIRSWSEGGSLSAEQCAFSRVNSFITGGRSVNLDADLMERNYRKEEIESLEEEPITLAAIGMFALATSVKVGIDLVAPHAALAVTIWWMLPVGIGMASKLAIAINVAAWAMPSFLAAIGSGASIMLALKNTQKKVKSKIDGMTPKEMKKLPAKSSDKSDIIKIFKKSKVKTAIKEEVELDERNYRKEEIESLEEELDEGFLDKVKAVKDFAKNKILKIKKALSSEKAETKKMLSIYKNRKNASKADLKYANDQFKDVLKGLGLVTFTAIPVPGGGLLLAALTTVVKKKFNINILPSAFYEEVELDERNYRKEYDNYQGRPEQIARRASRNQARKIMGDKAVVGLDVGHKDNNPLNNTPANLRNEDPSDNRREPRLREKLAPNASQQDYIDDFIKSDAPQFKGKDKDKRIAMAIAAYKSKNESINEAWYNDLAAKFHQITHPKGWAEMMIRYAAGMKYPEHRKHPEAWAGKVAQEYNNIQTRQLIKYINKLVKQGKLPKELTADMQRESFNDFVAKNNKEIEMTLESTIRNMQVVTEASKYDLYHKDFSSAMQHAYKAAKKMYGITIDPKEIDDKVASGPKKPSSGKTNKYRLKGDKGAIQVQVYNMDNKKYELNMYKEEVELDEANVAKFPDDVLKSRMKQMRDTLKTRGDSPATQFMIKRLEKEMKKRGLKEEDEIDEARQLKDPKKEVMVSKGGKVIVIDKKDQDKYLKKGWVLAEEDDVEDEKDTEKKAKKDEADTTGKEKIEINPTVTESAASDARRDIRKDKDLGRRKDSADDDDEATPQDRTKLDTRNVIMQLKKAADNKNHKVKFDDGKSIRLKPDVVKAALVKFSKLKPNVKEKVQAQMQKSYKDMIKALNSIKEEADLDEAFSNIFAEEIFSEELYALDEDDLNEYLESLDEEEFVALEEFISESPAGDLAKKLARGAGKLAVKGAKAGAKRLSTQGRADAADEKADSTEKKAANKERIVKAKERIEAAKERIKKLKDKAREAKTTEAKKAVADSIVKAKESGKKAADAMKAATASEQKENYSMERMGVSRDLVNSVRDVLMGKRPVEVDEGDKEEYQKFFKAALKKFGVGSPSEFKSDEEKKKFFDYIEKNWTKDEK